MRRLQDIDPPAAMGRPARGGPRGPSGIDEKPDGAQPDAPASPSLAGNEPASGHVSGQDQNSDLEKYLVHIAHLDLALPVKIELIAALRDIMQSFVDRAFGDDPVQHCQQIADQAGNQKAGSDKSQEANGLGGRTVETALAATDLAAKNLAEAALAEDSLNAKDATDSATVIASKPTTKTETTTGPSGSLRNECSTDDGGRKK